MPHPVWPLFDLVVRTPRLELRYPDDELGVALAQLAGRGIHPPEEMPFGVPWTRQAPGELEAGVLRFLWRSRAGLSAEDWRLPLGVLLDGEPVGLQEVFATGFPVRRTVETGSWVGGAFQGRGIGTEMRAAVLALAFEHLGAVEARTACWVDNPRSHGVTRRLGYLEDGSELLDREGTAVRMRRFRLPVEAWSAPFPIEVTGAEGLTAVTPKCF